MKKLYCPYCNVFLAHVSSMTRKQHNKGRLHIQYKIEYYRNVFDVFPDMHPGTDDRARAVEASVLGGPRGDQVFMNAKRPLGGVKGSVLIPKKLDGPRQR